MKVLSWAAFMLGKNMSTHHQCYTPPLLQIRAKLFVLNESLNEVSYQTLVIQAFTKTFALVIYNSFTGNMPIELNCDSDSPC